MTSLLRQLISVWDGDESSFLLHSSGANSSPEIRNQEPVELTDVQKGKGVEARVVEEAPHARSESRMVGHVTIDFPFDEHGKYDTQNVVELRGGFLGVKGRAGESINVWGLKLLTSEVERVTVSHPNKPLAVTAKENPLTGQHVELLAEPKRGQIANEDEIRQRLEQRFPSHMVPSRIETGKLAIVHSFKKS